MRESNLQKEIKTLIIEESGKTKNEALGRVFTVFRKKVQTEVDGVIIKLEPLETYLLEQREEKKTERFLELFMPREKTTYFIKLEIEYEVKYIKL